MKGNITIFTKVRGDFHIQKDTQKLHSPVQYQLLTSAAVKSVLFQLKNVTESVKSKRKKTPVPSLALQFLQKLGLPNPKSFAITPPFQRKGSAMCWADYMRKSHTFLLGFDWGSQPEGKPADLTRAHGARWTQPKVKGERTHLFLESRCFFTKEYRAYYQGTGKRANHTAQMAVTLLNALLEGAQLAWWWVTEEPIENNVLC